MLAIALLSTALAQPRWFRLRGGSCPHAYLGVIQFFAMGPPLVHSSNVHAAEESCWTPRIASMMRLIIAFSFLSIASSLVAFILDTVGTTSSRLKSLRQNAVGSVFTVFFTVIVIGLCYYVTTLIEGQQELSRMHPGSRVEVKFDISFYLITAAGSIAVLATAANLLHKPQTLDEESVNGLLEDYDGLETFSIGYPSRVDVSPMHFLPPPPPYTP